MMKSFHKHTLNNIGWKFISKLSDSLLPIPVLNGADPLQS